MPKPVRLAGQACFAKVEIAGYVELLQATAAILVAQRQELHAQALSDLADELEARLAEGA